MTNKSGTPGEFWHIRHLCGHSVYWSDMVVAFRTGASPCPWCGAEDGNKVPQDVAMMRDSRMGIYAFREKLPDGRVPWPSDMPNASGRVILRHSADNSCCSN